MYKSVSIFAGFKLNALLLCASAALLAGCTSDGAGFDDQYVPSTHYERYPIKVAKAPMHLEVASRKGGLQPNQINAISAFARSASTASVTKIAIGRPSGGGHSRQGAEQIYRLLVANGVPAGQISQTVYRGSAGAPVTLSYTRAVAVTEECGDWSGDLTYSPNNEPYPNFGCSIQHNIAQMVSNPNDFEVPAAPSPVQSRNRNLIKSPDDANVRRIFFYFNQ
jgi:pilus assembly protein CpaD